MSQENVKFSCIRFIRGFRKRKHCSKFTDVLKTLLVCLIFIVFLYQTFLYRFHPPFWFVFLIFAFTAFIAFRRRFFKRFMVLLIPTLVSKRGRSAIVGYIFILTLSGSVVNIMRNVEETVECLCCAQEHLKKLLQGVVKGLMRPFGDIKQMILRIQNHILNAMKEIEDRLISIKDKVAVTVGNIRKAFGWLKSLSNLCQENLGSPFEKCIESLNRMIEKCEEDLGIAAILCNLNYLLQPLCIPMQVLKFMCVAVEYVGEAILGVIEKMMEKITDTIKKMFLINVEFDSDFDFETTSSRNWSEIRVAISNELKKKTDKFVSFIGFMEILSLIFILWLFYKVFRYQTQYLKRDDYKNCYITHEFHEIEERCVEHGREHVLPLRGDEKDLYADMRYKWLIRYERRKLLRSFPFLLLSNIQIFTILFTDYSIHWILATIRDYDQTHLTPLTSGYAIVEVSGTGPLAEMYKNVIREFEPILKGFTTDFRDCLPNPSPPDMGRFRITIFLIVVCWIFLLLEPLSLRVQQLVMDSFHPDRARKRSAWLHAEILRRRKSLLSIAAQRMLQMMRGDQEEQKDGFFRVLWEKIRHTRCLNFFLGHQWKEFCLSCATPSHQDYLEPCDQLECPGLFCSTCLSQEDFSCPLCDGKFNHLFNEAVAV